MESLVDACIKDGVEFEKCVVSQHKTTIEQRDIFAAHIKNHPRTKIPIEWVIGKSLMTFNLGTLFF